jgi:hypothetical protein
MRTAALLIALALAGCVNPERVRRDVADQPPAFQDGYVDGCSSGRRAGGEDAFKFRKDLNRYDVDRLYRSGWEDGFKVCRSRSLS